MLPRIGAAVANVMNASSGRRYELNCILIGRATVVVFRDAGEAGGGGELLESRRVRSWKKSQL